jgi:DNA-binding transcriptional ArsR family regulator
MARKRERRVAKRPATPPTPEKMVRAMNHPVRVQVVRILLDRTAGPKAIAEALDMRLSNVSYHVRVLADLDLVEIAEEESVRGAVAHFYRARWPEEMRAALDQFKFGLPAER